MSDPKSQPSSSSSSSPSPPSPAQLQPPQTWAGKLARRIDDTTGKEYLGSFCAVGLGMELLWQTQVELRMLRTPAPSVRRAVIRAAVLWPSLYVFAGLAFRWAAWKVR